MESISRLQQQLLRFRGLPTAVVCLMLALLGGTIYLGTLQLRQKIRNHIVKRDAEIGTRITDRLRYGIRVH